MNVKLQGRVQPLGSGLSIGGAQDADLIQGRQQELIVTELMGKYYTQAYNGNVFSARQAAAGAVVPIFSNTTQQCGLFNPLGSGKNLVPVKLNGTYVSTTAAAGGFCLGYVTNCGGGIATGSAGITAATLVTPVNLNIGAGGKPAGIFMSAAITTAAPAVLMDLGVDQLVTTAATTSLGFFPFSYDFDGTVIVPPGNAIFVAGNIAVLITMVFNIIWVEAPI